jgi:hypothetical protein
VLVFVEDEPTAEGEVRGVDGDVESVAKRQLH